MSNAMTGFRIAVLTDSGSTVEGFVLTGQEQRENARLVEKYSPEETGVAKYCENCNFYSDHLFSGLNREDFNCAVCCPECRHVTYLDVPTTELDSRLSAEGLVLRGGMFEQVRTDGIYCSDAFLLEGTDPSYLYIRFYENGGVFSRLFGDRSPERKPRQFGESDEANRNSFEQENDEIEFKVEYSIGPQSQLWAYKGFVGLKSLFFPIVEKGVGWRADQIERISFSFQSF